MGLKNLFGLLQSEVSQVMSIWKKSSQNGFMEMRNFRERAVGLNPVSSSPYWTKWVINYIKLILCFSVIKEQQWLLPQK